MTARVLPFPNVRLDRSLAAARGWLRREANSINHETACHALRVLQALNSVGLVPLHPRSRAWLERHAADRRWPVMARWAVLLLEELEA